VKGSVFVVIRFPLSRYQACKNSLIKYLPVHRIYSGEVSGICRSVSCQQLYLNVFAYCSFLSSLVSGYTSQHILSWYPTPEIGHPV